METPLPMALSTMPTLTTVSPELVTSHEPRKWFKNMSSSSLITLEMEGGVRYGIQYAVAVVC